MFCVQHGGSPACEDVNRKYGFTCPKCSNTVGPVVAKRVKCKACGQDIHIDHFAGVHDGDFYCDAIPCLLVMSDRISNLEVDNERPVAK
jgi:transcription elongation factor Elf1